MPISVNTTSVHRVTTYPVPDGEAVYDGYQLRIAGQPVEVYACRVSAVPLNQWWPGYQRPVDQTELAGFAYWDMEGGVTVEITTEQEIDTVVIRPLSLGIEPEVEGNRIRFVLDRIVPIAVEVNGLHHALHLFPNPMQEEVPEAPSPVCCSQCSHCSPRVARLPESPAPGFYYFGPGLHDVGTLVLHSNDSVYIAGGAVVYGNLIADDADNIRVWGRGVLDGGHIRRAGKWADFGCIHFRNSTNISIEGIVLRDPNCWGITLRGCRKAVLSNLKFVGFWRYNADGIDLMSCEDVAFENCFIRSFDDVFVVRDACRNIRCCDCVFWCDWGNCLGLAGSPIENVTFRNIDLIRLAHAATVIRSRGKEAVRDIQFDTVNLELDDWIARPRIQKLKNGVYVPEAEDDYCPRLFSVVVQAGDGPRDAVANISYENISVYGNRRPASSFRGFDAEHEVNGIRIKNLRFNDRPVKTVEEANLTIGPHVNGVRLNAEGM